MAGRAVIRWPRQKLQQQSGCSSQLQIARDVYIARQLEIHFSEERVRAIHLSQTVILR
jgi:hypothetical protein